MMILFSRKFKLGLWDMYSQERTSISQSGKLQTTCSFMKPVFKVEEPKLLLDTFSAERLLNYDFQQLRKYYKYNRSLFSATFALCFFPINFFSDFNSPILFFIGWSEIVIVWNIFLGTRLQTRVIFCLYNIFFDFSQNLLGQQRKYLLHICTIKS